MGVDFLLHERYGILSGAEAESKDLRTENLHAVNSACWRRLHLQHIVAKILRLRASPFAQDDKLEAQDDIGGRLLRISSQNRLLHFPIAISTKTLYNRPIIFIEKGEAP